MTGIRLYTSNRLEILAEKLADYIKEPLASPLGEEVIVVQSRGMQKWISMQIARRQGILANCRFPFPNAFFHEVIRKFLPDLPESSRFDPRIMAWEIMGLLPDLITKPGFESLKNYFGKTINDLKMFQLSVRIADTFDQYLLFRPEWIFRWEKGQEEHWQAELWRRLVNGKEKTHRAALGKAFNKAVNKASTEIKGLPERISVFGISAIPHFYMQVLAGISRIIRVNLFLMNPCREYWGDILSGWEMKRTTKRENGRGAEELHLEKGNSLLASMGALGREFFDLVYEFDCEEFGFFKDPGEGNLLFCVQSDILNLQDVQQRSDDKKIVAEDDRSIQIHSCHSPMREIEVLQDRLLDMFERNPGLSPRDILVMTPDIESYAPYIQAVFDIPADDARRIPFSIADRNIRQEGEIADTFLAILDICGNRFGASQVVGILESQEVRDRFGLLESDLELVQGWVKETRIRWGIDGKSREDLDLPPFPENTWKAGLSRMLLGYAMAGKEENMFGGVLPYDNIEGSDTVVLGRFYEFFERLSAYVVSLGQKHTLREWSKILTGLLENFFLSDETTETETQLIRRTLNDLIEIQETTAFHEEIDIKAVKSFLVNFLQRKGFGFGFLAGGVTFCAMLPMRSIPFKVICLVGMNNDAYPRQSGQLGFNLMEKHPKAGDRSRRNDDRYLFLEAVLSARERLYISYVGQSVQDNSSAPPSVLVSELVDYIEQGFKIKGKSILEHVITKHRLQAFSPEYFKKNERLFSYSGENLSAAQCILRTRKKPLAFILKRLPEPDMEWKTLSLDDLSGFFGNPSRFCLERRLGIYLRENTSILEETEAFDIKGLEKYLLEKSMVEKRFAGQDLKNLFSVKRASGLLPHGTVGECKYDQLRLGVEGFFKKTEPYLKKTYPKPFEVDMSISGFRLTGRIDLVYPDRLIQYRYARLKPEDRIKAWIYHLALNYTAPDHLPKTTMLIGLDPNPRQDSVWVALEYAPVENSEEIFDKLLMIYWAGMVRPLHFFARSSFKYAQLMLLKNKSKEDALQGAGRIWMGNEYNRGEREDPYCKLCFGNTDPINSEFQDIAKQVFGPLLEHQKEMSK